jgi:hypothetical protein
MFVLLYPYLLALCSDGARPNPYFHTLATVRRERHYLALRRILGYHGRSEDNNFAFLVNLYSSKITMQLIKQQIERDGSGTVTLKPEDPEDMVGSALILSLQA